MKEIYSDRVCKVKSRKKTTKKDKFVVYWLQSNQRVRYNHTLEYSIKKALEKDIPLVVIFNINFKYKDSNKRSFRFLLESLKNLRNNLKDQGIEIYLVEGDLCDILKKIEENIDTLIYDKGYLEYEKVLREGLKKAIDTDIYEVESNLLVPIESASDKEEYSARTLRIKLKKIYKDYLEKDLFNDGVYESRGKLKDSKKVEKLLNKVYKKNLVTEILDRNNLDELLDERKVEGLNKERKLFVGGEDEGLKLLKRFKKKVGSYGEKSSNIVEDGTSFLSPYLHFGNLSPLDILKTLEVEDIEDDFMEQLIVRRELAFNFIYYNEGYSRWDEMTYSWAYETMEDHRDDKREYEYTLKELEEGKTHDEYWNKAQREIYEYGYLHNYLRMYWGKKIYEWTKTPKEAYERILHLNNKYFVDGRDPVSYASIAWIFGKHDRGWKEREVFGKLRYMNSNGLKRKFKMEEYMKKKGFNIKEDN